MFDTLDQHESVTSLVFPFDLAVSRPPEVSFELSSSEGGVRARSGGLIDKGDFLFGDERLGVDFQSGGTP